MGKGHEIKILDCTGLVGFPNLPFVVITENYALIDLHHVDSQNLHKYYLDGFLAAFT